MNITEGGSAGGGQGDSAGVNEDLARPSLRPPQPRMNTKQHQSMQTFADHWCLLVFIRGLKLDLPASSFKV
jgi:hypothetical protein